MNIDDNHYKSSIVKICADTESSISTVGTGFLSTRSGLIITCAHVISTYTQRNKAEVTITFLTNGEVRKAFVEKRWYRSQTSEDIAILKLLGPLPSGAVPLPIGPSWSLEGRQLLVFGFPENKPVEGLAGRCEYMERTKTESGIVVIQVRSPEITQGFSGSPIVDPYTRKAVGILTSITAPDRNLRLGETAFALPSDILASICPQLENPNVQELVQQLPLKGFHLSQGFVDLNVRVKEDPGQVPRPNKNIVDQLRLDESYECMLRVQTPSGDEINSREVQSSSNLIESLKSHPRCVLLGDPGSGKTTALGRLAIESAKKRLDDPTALLPLPVLVDLSKWQDEHESPFEFIRSQWNYATSPFTSLRLGEAILLLDGLNELGSSFEKKAELLAEWLESSSGPTNVIVSCRRDVYLLGRFSLDFPEIEILGMSHTYIKKLSATFLEACNIASNPFIEILFEVDETNGKTSELLKVAANPFMLTALLLSYQNHTESSSNPSSTSQFKHFALNKGLLFRELLGSIWTYESKKNSFNGQSSESFEKQMAKLAYTAIESGWSLEFPAYEMKKYFTNSLALDSALKLAADMHILDSDVSNIRFRYQLIQEYYAAVWILKYESRPSKFLDLTPYTARIKGGERTETRWDQSITMLCGLLDELQANALVLDILKQKDPYLAVLCVSSGVKVEKSTIEKIVDSLLKNMRGWGGLKGSLQQEMVSKSLVQIGSPTVSTLGNYLVGKQASIPSVRLQYYVAGVLGEIGDPLAIPALEKSLYNSGVKIKIPLEALAKALQVSVKIGTGCLTVYVLYQRLSGSQKNKVQEILSARLPETFTPAKIEELMKSYRLPFGSFSGDSTTNIPGASSNLYSDPSEMFNNSSFNRATILAAIASTISTSISDKKYNWQWVNMFQELFKGVDKIQAEDKSFQIRQQLHDAILSALRKIDTPESKAIVQRYWSEQEE